VYACELRPGDGALQAPPGNSMQDCFRPCRVLEDGCFPCRYESLGLAASDFGLCQNDVLREGQDGAALVVSPIPGGYRVRRGVGLGGGEEGRRGGLRRDCVHLQCAGGVQRVGW